MALLSCNNQRRPTILISIVFVHTLLHQKTHCLHSTSVCCNMKSNTCVQSLLDQQHVILVPVHRLFFFQKLYHGQVIILSCQHQRRPTLLVGIGLTHALFHQKPYRCQTSFTGCSTKCIPRVQRFFRQHRFVGYFAPFWIGIVGIRVR